MQKMKLKYIAILCSLMMLVSASAFAEGDAGSRAAYTRGGWAGARYVAMGKAAEVIVDDVFAIYWNPAGLRELLQKNKVTAEEIEGKAKSGDVEGITEEDLTNFSEDNYTKSFLQIGVSSSVLPIDREAGFAGLAFNLFNGVLGAGVYSIQSDGIEQRDETGNYIKDLNYNGSVGFLSYGWGYGVTSMGISLKGLYEKMGDIAYYGAGCDIGTQVELIPFVKFGFVVQDIGSGLKPSKTYENINSKYDFATPTLKISAAITNRTSDFVAAVSGIKKLEQSGYDLNFGIQYNMLKHMILYVGLSESMFSSGTSIKFFNTEIIYAFSLDKLDLGYNNTISLTLTL